MVYLAKKCFNHHASVEICTLATPPVFPLRTAPARVAVRRVASEKPWAHAMAHGILEPTGIGLLNICDYLYAAFWGLKVYKCVVQIEITKCVL